VWALVAIRIAFEAFCLVTILIGCARNSLLLGCRVWFRGSVFLPLLAVRSATRIELLEEARSKKYLSPVHSLIPLIFCVVGILTESKMPRNMVVCQMGFCQISVQLQPHAFRI
jgi:hypothetical protein